MALEIQIGRFGGPEVLEARDVPAQAPRRGELRIRHTAIGVNFTDVHGRRGDYEPLHALPMPLVLGIEAVGVVEAVGEGVTSFRAGDRVGYASGPIGAYRQVRNFPAERCVAQDQGLVDAITGAAAQVVQIYEFACQGDGLCSGWVAVPGAPATRYAMRFEGGAWRFDSDRRIIAE